MIMDRNNGLKDMLVLVRDSGRKPRPLQQHALRVRSRLSVASLGVVRALPRSPTESYERVA